MSFSNTKVLKAVKRREDAVHINELLLPSHEEYIKRTARKQLDKIKEEYEAWRKEEMDKYNAEIQAMRDEAYATAYEEIKMFALMEAREEMEQQVRAELAEEYNKALQVFDDANTYYKEQLKKVEKTMDIWLRTKEEEIGEIIINTVRRVLENSINLDLDEIRELIKASINEVKDESRTIYVKVHPDVKMVAEMGEWAERNVEWLADPKLNLLDVLIETDVEFIDCTLENKMTNVERMIREWVADNELLGNTEVSSEQHGTSDENGDS